MEIKKAALEDIPEIVKVYDIARMFMRANGNLSQWGGGYPGEPLLRGDIQAGNLYILCADGAMEGVFAFIPGEDPTYRYIEDGNWHRNRPYGTIHRLASRGTAVALPRPALTSAGKRSPICALIPMRIITPCKTPSCTTASGNAAPSIWRTGRPGSPLTICRASKRRECLSNQRIF